VLVRLVAGNQRFVSGKTERLGRKPEDFAADAKGQAPMAIIIACADSRVAPELIFDQGVGDLFVVRVAGNVVGGAGAIVKGSIEFGVAELGARFIMVLGHSKCGAVKAAIEHIEAEDQLPGSIGDLVKLIRPAVIESKGKPGDKLENVTRANVMAGVKQLGALSPILSKHFNAGELKIVGATYQLSTGKVELYS
jgi:carbonic anhydrase